MASANLTEAVIPGENGQPVLIEAHTPIDGEGCCDAWLVEKSYVDIFYSEIGSDDELSRRHHISRRHAGELFFSLPRPNSGRYIVVGSATIRRVDLAQLPDPAIVKAIEDWVLATTPRPAEFTSQAFVLAAGDNPAMKSGAHVTGPGEPLWITAGPEMLVDGHSAAKPAETAPMPLAGRGWAMLLEDGTFDVRATELLIGTLSVPELLAQHHQLLEARMLTKLASEDAALRQQGSATLEQERLQKQQAFEALGKIFGLPAAQDDLPPSESLNRALDRIADCLKVRRPETARSALRLASSDPDIKTILDQSGLRYRKIRLSSTWWKREAGPLLAFVENKTNSEPVALLPAGSGYQLFDPKTGLEEKVSAKQVSALLGSAYAFYAPLPDRTLSLIDILRFSLEGARNDLFLLLTASVATAMLGVLVPYFTSSLISDAIPNSDVGMLVFIALVLMGAAVAQAIFAIGRGFTMLALESKADNRVEAGIWDRILRLPAPFFRRFNAGELAMRAAGLSAARRAVSQASVQALFGVLSIPAQLFMMYHFFPSLAHWALAVTAFAVMLYCWIARIAVRERRAEMLARSRISGVMLQLLTGINKIRVAGKERRAFHQWARRFAEQKRHSLMAQRQSGWLAVMNSALPTFTLLIIFAIAAFKLMPDADTVFRTSDFIAFISALVIFQGSIMAVVGAVIHSISLKPLADLSRPILSAATEPTDTRAIAPKFRGRLTMQRIKFRYADDGPLILKDVSIEAEPGEFIALVGPSGSGKSTAFRILLGFETPEAGSVLYDGNQLQDLDLRSVRRQLGVVLQTGRIIPGTILDNINGANDYGEDAVWEALAMAGMEEDVRQMPMGLYTTLSEGGGTMSGGQRQRLLIARAVVGKPPILLMDEATSALDNRTQDIVSRSLKKMNSTRVVIAHRLSTIRDADRIYVLRDGVVEEVGNADELMEKGGLFAQMARRQIA